MEDARQRRGGPAAVGDGTRSGYPLNLDRAVRLVSCAEDSGNPGSRSRGSHTFWHLEPLTK
jgi:hypothetical protein